MLAYANLKGARANTPGYFSDIKELAAITAEWKSDRMIDLWNSIPGNTPVKKFMDRKTALRRIWNAVQSLNAPDVPATPGARVEEASEPQGTDEGQVREGQQRSETSEGC